MSATSPAHTLMTHHDITHT